MYTKRTGFCPTRTGFFAKRTPPRRLQLSPEWRVVRNGAFISGCGSGKRGYLLTPFHKTQNSGNELNDLLEIRGLAEMTPKNELVFAQNELGVSQNELVGSIAAPSIPNQGPTAHPSCSSSRKRRRTSPHGLRMSHICFQFDPQLHRAGQRSILCRRVGWKEKVEETYR